MNGLQRLLTVIVGTFGIFIAARDVHAAPEGKDIIVQVEERGDDNKRGFVPNDKVPANVTLYGRLPDGKNSTDLGITINGVSPSKDVACPDGTGNCFVIPPSALAKSVASRATVSFACNECEDLTHEFEIDASAPPEDDPPEDDPPKEVPETWSSEREALQAAFGVARRTLARRYGKELDAAKECGEDILTAPRALKKRLQRVGCTPRSFSDARKDMAFLLYREDGALVGSPPEIDENDEVFVYVAGRPTTVSADPSVKTCDAPPLVRVYSGDDSPLTLAGKGDDKVPYRVYELKADSCSADSGLEVEWGLTKEDEDDNTVKSVIKPDKTKILPLYRLSVGVAAIFDFTPIPSYRAATAKGEAVPIVVRDAPMQGLRAVAFTSLRLRRVSSTRRRTRILEMLAPAVGVSLRNPLDHLYVGLHIEPFPGLGVIGGIHPHREPTLAGGLEEGDRVPSGSISTDKRWTLGKEDWFVGFAFDALILTRLVKALRG